MTPFQTAWHEKSKEKKSRLVAGLDPARFLMNKGEQGLPEDADLLRWGQEYIDAIAPHSVALKYNGAFFQEPNAASILPELVAYAKTLELLIIADVKVSDIGSSNDAWIFGHHALGADAITLAPYAGNAKETVEMCQARAIASILVCVMSNPEYEREMHAKDENGVPLYQSRIDTALSSQADAIVVGGTYDSNDPILSYVVEKTKATDTLYLIPGIGAQGGSVETVIQAGLDPGRCMFSSSRGLMFPHGSHSTPEAQKEEAERLQAATYSQ